jgi:lipopolysaccharide export system permease protein
VIALSVLSGVLVISQLVRLTDVLANFGFSFENILLPFLFIILPFLSFTIPMAFLFAVMISFSRLSADGEYTGLLAAGFSLARASRPILLVAAILYVVAACCGLYLEPWGRRELLNFYQRKAQTEIDNVLRYKLQAGTFMDDFLGFVLYAEKISKDRTRLKNVILAPGAKMTFLNDFTLMAPDATIVGSVEQGTLKMGFEFGVINTDRKNGDSTVMKFRRAEVDVLRIFQEQIFGSEEVGDDYRSLPPGRLLKYIDELVATESDPKKIAKARFLFHQRAGNAFTVIFFAMMGMYLGIQDQRRGKGSAWINAIIVLIVGYVLTMVFKWLAENSYMPAWSAAWTPNFLLTAFGLFLIYQKNRLPVSESAFSPEALPWIGRFFRKHSAASPT